MLGAGENITVATLGAHPGDTVWAFHPRMFGVMKYGTVVRVGRKYLTVNFAPYGEARVLPRDVIQVLR